MKKKNLIERACVEVVGFDARPKQYVLRAKSSVFLTSPFSVIMLGLSATKSFFD